MEMQKRFESQKIKIDGEDENVKTSTANQDALTRSRLEGLSFCWKNLLQLNILGSLIVSSASTCLMSRKLRSNLPMMTSSMRVLAVTILQPYLRKSTPKELPIPALNHRG